MQDRFEINSTSGNLIRGRTQIPPGSDALVIACHGFTSSMNDSFKSFYEAKLIERNIGIVRFDFSGHGISGGKFEDISIKKGLEDLDAVMTYVIKTYKDYKILFYGRSFGGTVSYIYTCTRSKQVSKSLKALVLNAPAIDYKAVLDAYMSEDDINKWQQDKYILKKNNRRLAYNFYEDLKMQPTYEVAELLNIPTLVVHGSQDRTVPIDQVIKLSKLSRFASLTTVEGAGHKMIERHHIEKAVDDTVSFICHQLT